MKGWLRWILPAVVGFFVGVLASGAVAYVVIVRDLSQGVERTFYQSAVEAQGAVRSLEALRRGDTQRVLSALELRMDSAVITLAAYETVVPVPRREEYVYRTLAEVAAYRKDFPAQFEYPGQYTYYNQALGLAGHHANPQPSK